MKKINEILEEYFDAIDKVDLDMFEESYNGVDPYYAKKVITKLEHIFYCAYGNGMNGLEARQYLVAPTVLSSKRAGAAVIGIYLSVVDYQESGSKRGAHSVLRIFVPEKYQRMEKLKDFLQYADHVNDGKICYYAHRTEQKQAANPVIRIR